jgi:hypothetical protein
MERVALTTSIIKTALEKCPEYEDEEGKRLKSGTSRFTRAKVVVGYKAR